MGRWHLTVQSTYLATAEQVWQAKTDPELLAREFQPYLTLKMSDLDGLKRALQGEVPASFRGKLAGPIGRLHIPWPMTIEASVPPVQYRDSSTNVLYSEFIHVHRFEPSGRDRIRYVDDVTFTPRARPSWTSAQLTRLLFLHRHQMAGQTLRPDAVEGTRAVLRRLK